MRRWPWRERLQLQNIQGCSFRADSAMHGDKCVKGRNRRGGVARVGRRGNTIPIFGAHLPVRGKRAKYKKQGLRFKYLSFYYAIIVAQQQCCRIDIDVLDQNHQTVT